MRQQYNLFLGKDAKVFSFVIEETAKLHRLHYYYKVDGESGKKSTKTIWHNKYGTKDYRYIEQFLIAVMECGNYDSRIVLSGSIIENRETKSLGYYETDISKDYFTLFILAFKWNSAPILTLNARLGVKTT